MLVAAIVLEVCCLGTLSLVLVDASPRDYWLWTLLVVGILFVPMAVAFGPRMALLAALCVGMGMGAAVLWENLQ